MKNRVLDELEWELNKLVENLMAEDHYVNEELLRERVSREFTEWLVNNFKKDCGYTDE